MLSGLEKLDESMLSQNQPNHFHITDCEYGQFSLYQFRTASVVSFSSKVTKSRIVSIQLWHACRFFYHLTVSIFTLQSHRLDFRDSIDSVHSPHRTSHRTLRIFLHNLRKATSCSDTCGPASDRVNIDEGGNRNSHNPINLAHIFSAQSMREFSKKPSYPHTLHTVHVLMVLPGYYILYRWDILEFRRAYPTF